MCICTPLTWYLHKAVMNAIVFGFLSCDFPDRSVSKVSLWHWDTSRITWGSHIHTYSYARKLKIFNKWPFNIIPCHLASKMCSKVSSASSWGKDQKAVNCETCYDSIKIRYFEKNTTELTNNRLKKQSSKILENRLWSPLGHYQQREF